MSVHLFRTQREMMNRGENESMMLPEWGRERREKVGKICLLVLVQSNPYYLLREE